MPNLIDDGLAIGGAASAIGIDFPYPNFTGPATAMGLLIAQAARKIRDEGGTFTRDELQRHYLEPLQQDPLLAGRGVFATAGRAMSRRPRSSSAATSTWPLAALTFGHGRAQAV